MHSHPKRGDVVRVDLGPVVGSEQDGTRPVVVISPDLINQHSPVILIAACTGKNTDRVYPFETLVEPPDGGLTMRSKVSLMQIKAVDKRRITGYYGSVSPTTIDKIEEALAIATGLHEL